MASTSPFTPTPATCASLSPHYHHHHHHHHHHHRHHHHRYRSRSQSRHDSFIFSLAPTTIVSLRLPPCTRGPSAGWLTPHLASPPMRVATRARALTSSTPLPLASPTTLSPASRGSSNPTHLWQLLHDRFCWLSGCPFTPPHSVYPALL